MKKLTIIPVLFFVSLTGFSQSKIFKQVAGAVRTEVNEIVENKSVVGYTSLTQLEKTDKNNFNYELTVMDENLNDLGNIKFNDIDMDLTSVAFEQDVLCITFYKSKAKNNFFRSITEDFTSIYFVDLKGNIINKIEKEAKGYRGIVALNVPQKGFLVYTPAEHKINMYNIQGKLVWEKHIGEGDAESISTSKDMVAYYQNKSKTFDFIDANDGKRSYTFTPTNSDKYNIQVLSSKTIGDKIYFAGSTYTKKPIEIMKQLKRGYNKGVFTIEASGLSKDKIKEKVNLWADGSNDVLNKDASFPENRKEQVIITSSIVDNNGNAYFYGSNFNRSLRVGYTVATVALSPLILPPLYMSILGYNKYYYQNGTIFRLDNKGIFSIYSTIETEKSRKMLPKTYVNWEFRPTTGFSNLEATENYFISYDKSQHYIFNLNSKKIKSIPRKQSGISTSLFPAKEGHIMVIERDKNEKSTKLSIVAL